MFLSPCVLPKGCFDLSRSVVFVGVGLVVGAQTKGELHDSNVQMLRGSTCVCDGGSRA